MSAKIKYTNEPLGEPKVMKDFLPSPAELAFNEEAVKVNFEKDKDGIQEVLDIQIALPDKN